MNGWQYKTEFSPQNDRKCERCVVCTNQTKTYIYTEKVTNHDARNQVRRPGDKIDFDLSIMDAIAEPSHHSK